MASTHDIVIRGGTIVDGSGGAPFEGDIAITDGRIAAVGRVEGRGREEIDARDRIVTPGFVDIHTHYDGQATWESRMVPSSGHGISTVVTGNCGVGFAPCRPADRETLIEVLEGVEDIPEVVMAEGLPWNWETFPEYLDALATRRFDVDIATQLPHSPLRVYVMGERGVRREPSTAEDRRRMRELTAQAIRAGALGVTTSRSHFHRTVAGELSPSVEAEEAELMALGDGLRDAGAGVYQLLPDVPTANVVEEFELLARVARACGRPLSFTLAQSNTDPQAYRGVLDRLSAARREGLEITAQIMPRPIGVLYGLDLSLHPLKLKPSFRPLEKLPLAEKVRALRDPALRARLIAEDLQDDNPVLVYLAGRLAELCPLGDPPDYFPAPEKRIAAIAERRGVPVIEAVYDALLERDGQAILLLPATNFSDGNQDAALEQLRHPHTVIGLGDGGAHYGMICDASYPTFVLTHWARGGHGAAGVDLPGLVRNMSHTAARTVGLTDRGLLAPGLKADVNVIDYDRLQLRAPHTVRDLPAGGRRLRQEASGYAVNIVSGTVTYRDGQGTGALPGRLVRNPAVPR